MSDRTMPQARLRIDLPRSHWLGDLSREYASLTVDVESVVGCDDCVLRLTLRRMEVGKPLEELGNRDHVDEIEVLGEGESEATCVVAVAADPIVAAVTEAGTPIEFPFRVQNGRTVLQVATLGEQLAGLEEMLDEAGLPWSIDHIKQSISSESPLTRHQRVVLEAALVEGYYDTPRRCTLTELAAELDIAKSTCCETLQRAESTVMEAFLAGDDRMTSAGRHGTAPHRAAQRSTE